MKKLFLAIRHGDIAEVKALISKNPELVNCVAKQPPKKDDGQSPLQVAFKTRNFDIAAYLIECGADVNFIDMGSINEWKAPVIHDAIQAVVGSAAWGRTTPGEATVDRAIVSLKSMVDKGANMTAQDSYGNNCAMRAVLTINNLSHIPDHAGGMNTFLVDLEPVLRLLINSSADFNEKTETRPPAIRGLHVGSPVADLLTRLVSEAS